MDLTIHSDNIRITQDLEDFVYKKLDKLNRYLPNISSVHVELGIQHSNRGPDIVVAQVTLRHERGAILRTEEKVDKQDLNSLHTAIINASEKMYRRISRFKGKRRDKRLREKFSMTPEELMIAEPLPDGFESDADIYEDDEDTESTLTQVIRRKQVGVTAMNEEEAIEQMELLGHSFFMFFNADSNTINVVYKRSNNGYGVLIPQVE
jgi:putative sigma-54 modulation protein